MERYLLVGGALTILGGVLWGLSGMSSQFIQQARMVDAEWLVSVRMIIAGVITVLGAYVQGRGTIFTIFKSKADTAKLCVFGILGILMCQYTYFKSIFHAGVGVATVLQYVGPTLIIIYVSLRYRKKPSMGEVVSVALATIGTAVIALQGDLSGSNLNGTILFWGLLSAVAVAIYSTQPVEILRRYGTGPVVGFAMIIGGLTAALIWTPFYIPGEWDAWTHLAFFGGIIFLGTVISFNAYLEGVRRIGAVKGSILSSVEPISAAFFGWLVLGNDFSMYDGIGFVLIIMTIFILAKEKESAKG